MNQAYATPLNLSDVGWLGLPADERSATGFNRFHLIKVLFLYQYDASGGGNHQHFYSCKRYQDISWRKKQRGSQ